MLFNYNQRIGLALVLCLLTAIFVVPRHFLADTPSLFRLPPPSKPVRDSLLMPADSSRAPVPVKTSVRKRKRRQPLELNRADSAALVRIRGIGPYYARKILRYRGRLGGFHHISQLKEIKMTYFNIDSCLHLFSVDSNLVRRKDLDSMEFKAVLRHPYLDYEDVCLIFNARRKYGKASFDTLEKYGILARHRLKKIRPYFK